MEQCTHALDKLIHAVTNDLVLLQPDPTWPYKMEVDASQYAVSMILYQPNDKDHWRPVGYFSHKLMQTE